MKLGDLINKEINKDISYVKNQPKSIETLLLQGFFPQDGLWSGVNIPPVAPYSIDVSGFDPGIYIYTYEYGENTCYTEDILILEIYERPNIYLWT